jgi:hypothetical protein
MSKAQPIEFTDEDRARCIEYARKYEKCFVNKYDMSREMRFNNLWRGKLGELVFYKAFGDKLVETEESILKNPKGSLGSDGGFDFTFKRTGITVDVKTINIRHSRLHYLPSGEEKRSNKIVVIRIDQGKNKGYISNYFDRDWLDKEIQGKDYINL